MKYLASALALFALFGGSALGHDFWLEPSAWRPRAGDDVSLSLHVGDSFTTEGERPLDRKGTVRFDAWLAGERTGLVADGKKPAAKLAVAKAGTCLVTLERSPRLIKLEAKKFEEYLKEESLLDVIARRKELGETREPGRERYGRGIKLLFRVGGKGDDGWKRIAGHKLEIVPLADPTGMKPGDELKVRVLFDGKPLAGGTLGAHRNDDGKRSHKGCAISKDGEAKVVLGKGVMLLRLVRMWRGDGKDADWESAWAALTFEVARR